MALTNLQSAFMYIGVVIFTYLLSIVANRTQKYFFILIITIILSCIIGLRSNTVGIDTYQYAYLYDNNYISWLGDIGFTFLSSIIKKFFDVNAFFFIIALMSCLFFMRGIWNLRDIADLPIMVLFFTCFSLFPLMNTIRQYLAVSIVFYSIKLLRKNNFVSFLIITTLTALIHSSVITTWGIVALVILYQWHSFSNNKKQLLVILILFLPVILYIVYSLSFSDNIQNKIGFYFHSFSFIGGIFGIFQLIVIIRTGRYLFKTKEKDMSFELMIYKIAVVGGGLNLIGYFIPFLNRTALAYIMFVFVAFGIYWKRLDDQYKKQVNKSKYFNRKNTITYLQAAQIVIYLYPFINVLLNDGYKVMNYQMYFW